MTEEELAGITITWTMLIAAIPVAFAIELIKAVLNKFLPAWREFQRPLIPLISIGFCMLCFRIAGQDSWGLGGILIGLSAGGGYDFIRGTMDKIKPGGTVPCLLLLLLLAGCGNVWMAPDYQAQFNNFNDSAHVWLDKCQADPNTCEQGLTNMVAELDVWLDIVNGTDPNAGGQI